MQPIQPSGLKFSGLYKVIPSRQDGQPVKTNEIFNLFQSDSYHDELRGFLREHGTNQAATGSMFHEKSGAFYYTANDINGNHATLPSDTFQAMERKHSLQTQLEALDDNTGATEAQKQPLRDELQKLKDVPELIPGQSFEDFAADFISNHPDTETYTIHYQPRRFFGIPFDFDFDGLRRVITPFQN